MVTVALPDTWVYALRLPQTPEPHVSHVRPCGPR